MDWVSSLPACLSSYLFARGVYRVDWLLGTRWLDLWMIPCPIDDDGMGTELMVREFFALSLSGQESRFMYIYYYTHSDRLHCELRLSLVRLTLSRRRSEPFGWEIEKAKMRRGAEKSWQFRR